MGDMSGHPHRAEGGLPRRKRGRQSAAAEEAYQADLDEFCDTLLQIRSTLDFAVSSRGWCYILEEKIGLTKGEFDTCQRTINECRKEGRLPLNICAEDSARLPGNILYTDGEPDEFAEEIVDTAEQAYESYQPFVLWDDVDVYIEMMVEKIDLKSLFAKVCAEFNIPIANTRGWADINARAAMLRRFAHWHRHNKKCILLYCGDHDPAGVQISDLIRSNLSDGAGAAGWWPTHAHLTIERFGLNADFIEANTIPWIENLETGSGDNLGNPRHKHHFMPYVQTYIAEHGKRKCEANALVVRPDAGRQLCRDTILKYVSEDQLDAYNARLEEEREAVAGVVTDLLRSRSTGT